MIASVRRRATAILSAALAALLVLAAPALAHSSHRAKGAQAGASSCPNGYVGLTFDDGPSQTLPQLLDALQANHLRATMFNQGNNALAHPDLVLAQRHARMWIGNHTFTHPNLPQIGEPLAFQEIASTQWVLTDITHRIPNLFRPPFGATSDQVRADAQRLHVTEVLWTVDSRDWAGATPEQIVAAAATLERGGIILMHDWPPATIQAIPGIAGVLRQKGMCAGKIVATHRDIEGAGSIFHAVAVRP